MEPDVPSIIEQLELRVLVEFDEDYGVYVGRCIDTGAVATGATIDEAQSSLKEVLQNDLRIAIEQGSLKSLFHAPSPKTEQRFGSCGLQRGACVCNFEKHVRMAGLV